MENQSLQLNEQAISALKEGAKWSYFLSILGFIGVGLMVLAAVFMSLIFSSLPTGVGSEYNNQIGFNPFSAASGFISFLYIIISVLYFFPIYYLYKYATGIKNALAVRDSILLSDALVYLKSHHKFLGITALVVISLYGFIFLLMILGFMFR